MYREKTVAVVVPAYNEEVLIRKVIETMPSFVDKILVVNDKSTDNTAVVVQEYVRRDPDRVALLDLKVNQGVGGAIAEWYKWARDSEIDCTAVMAGDAQMDPDDLPKLLDPGGLYERQPALLRRRVAHDSQASVSGQLGTLPADQDRLGLLACGRFTDGLHGGVAPSAQDP